MNNKMTDEQIAQQAKNMALGEVLSHWDDGLSYDDIIDIIEKSDMFVTDERVTIWEAFEDYDSKWLLNQLDNLKLSFIRAIQMGAEGSKQ